MEQGSLLQHFNQYFEFRPAYSPEDKSKAYHLRYQVYCEEFGFEDAASFPDKQEKDQFDENAEHMIMLHRESGLTAGCFRMVFADPIRNPQGLPIQHYCQSAVDPRLFEFSQQDPEHYVEVSRLAVHERFRRRTSERLTPTAVGRTDFESLSKQRDFPYIPLSMFLAVSALSEVNGMEYVVVMMEPRLARLLKLCGIHFQSIGNVVDYHGLRAPFISYVDQLRRYLTSEARELLDYLSHEFHATHRNEKLQLGRNYGAAL